MSAKEGTPGDWPAQIANAHHNIVKPREAGTVVYVYGDSAATVLFPDNEGAIVREHDDNSETWFEWRDLWHTPAGPLRFGISREWPNHPGFASWYVYGTRMTIQTPEQIADQIMKERTGGGYSPSIRKMMIAAIEADRRQLEHGEHIEPDFWDDRTTPLTYSESDARAEELRRADYLDGMAAAIERVDGGVSFDVLPLEGRWRTAEWLRSIAAQTRKAWERQ